MEASFLSFYDEKHFSDFSLSLDHQLLGESRNTFVRMVDNDFDYIEGLDLDSNDALWETEQELNGDLAVLPVSGVARAIPKIDNIKEDFAKVLTDWQEHIGYLQSTELEEDIDMINLDMGFDIDAVANSSNDTTKTSGYALNSPKSSEESLQNFNNVSVNSIKYEPNTNRINPFSEPDQSEKEIGSRVHIIKEESLDDIVIKEELLDIEDEMPLVTPTLVTSSAFSKSSKRKNKRKCKKEDVSKKSNKKNRKISKVNVRILDKSKTEIKSKIFIEETNNSNIAASSLKKAPVLEAGDVKSLLEQFEATEAASNTPRMPEISQMSKIPLKKNTPNAHVNNSQMTVLKISINSQDAKLHQDIRKSLPKEIINRIKASRCKRTISVIPAVPSKKTVSKNNDTRTEEAAATFSRNKLLKLVKNHGNSNHRLDGSVQLDHDYCSSASSTTSSNSSSESNGDPCSEQSRVSKAVGSGRAAAVKPWLDSGSKKDSGLESGEVSDDASEEQMPIAPKAATANRPAPALHETKIQSALAVSVLQQQKKGLVAGKSTSTPEAAHRHNPKQPMVSVLKRHQPTSPQKIVGSSKLVVESIITATSKSNGQVQSIIVQETSEVRPEDEEEAVAAERDKQEKKQQQQQPVRRKLNLAEYRSRRFEQNRSDGSRTSSPVQPMALVYVHHASTNTEPMCSEKEIVSLLKPKSELEEEKLRSKVPAEDKTSQTAQSVFGLYTGKASCSPVVLAPPQLTPDKQQREPVSEPLGFDNARQPRKSRKYRCTRAARASSSSSASRSRSRTRRDTRRRSRSRSRGRDRQSRAHSRSRSIASRRGRHCARRRRVSHRRSSVSSSSSWPSSSRSRSRPRPRSRSSSSPRYRSSSRSSCRSRSSRYSSCSRSPPSSNYGRSKQSTRQRRRNRDTNSDGYRGQFSASSRGYNDYKRKPYGEWYLKEKQRQVEERRVIYVGRVKDRITKAELRRRFEAFGPVVDISVHFREHGHNYGFVTFAYKNDAYQAVEHGNDDPTLPRYDLCFGGRRAFCKVKYADLDGAANGESTDENRGAIYKPEEENTFDLLLKEAQAKLRKRKV